MEDRLQSSVRLGFIEEISTAQVKAEMVQQISLSLVRSAATAVLRRKSRVGAGIHPRTRRCIAEAHMLQPGDEVADTLQLEGFRLTRGRYSHLKRDRLRTADSVLIRPNPRHTTELVSIMGMESAKASDALSLDEADPLDASPELDEEGIAIWLQQERIKNGLRVFKVPGEFNPSDLGTKCHPKARFLALRAMNGIVDCSEIDEHQEITAHK